MNLVLVRRKSEVQIRTRNFVGTYTTQFSDSIYYFKTTNVPHQDSESLVLILAVWLPVITLSLWASVLVSIKHGD